MESLAVAPRRAAGPSASHTGRNGSGVIDKPPISEP